MRNRPLLSVCLIILCVLTSCTLVGKERFIKELRPSPLEICTTEDESVIVCGVIYRQEQKENGQMIYLKHNSVYSISNKQKFQESKIIVYINSKEKLHIGNRIKVRGTVSFYEHIPDNIFYRSFILPSEGEKPAGTGAVYITAFRLWRHAMSFAVGSQGKICIQLLYSVITICSLWN